jgi:coenzyme F420-reducing hydrogenase delta subunit
MAAFDPQLSARIVAFRCRNSAWDACQTALQLNQASLPPGFTPITVPCAGKVDPDNLLRAFTSGAEGVLVLSCPQGNCKSTHGNHCAEWGEQVQDLRAEAGLDPGRLLFQSLAANAPRDLSSAVDQLMANRSLQAAETDPDHPVWLTTGAGFTQYLNRVKIHPRASLPQENPEVCIEIKAQDARQLGLQPGEQSRTNSHRGTITATARWSARVRPGLPQDDPYGDGWLMLIAATNLEAELETMDTGEGNAAWIEDESNRLLAMLEPSVGVTLQSGGALIDDVYAQYPELGWERLAKEFLRSA